MACPLAAGQQYPASSHRLPLEWVGGKEALVFVETEAGVLRGKPKPIDWSRLAALRSEQNRKAKLPLGRRNS
eukprot:1413883-Lingulodinium_polyedra.AAC.1